MKLKLTTILLVFSVAISGFSQSMPFESKSIQEKYGENGKKIF